MDGRSVVRPRYDDRNEAQRYVRYFEVSEMAVKSGDGAHDSAINVLHVRRIYAAALRTMASVTSAVAALSGQPVIRESRNDHMQYA